ncbi:MAG: RepB family plasmid replication initiator protein [Neisseriales bacterium]|nr:MAG: RepB family plasmid replication initiator protein [Neisseriales bacterium]
MIDPMIKLINEKNLNYSNRAILQVFQHYLIEHRAYFTDNELKLVGFILDQTSLDDFELVKIGAKKELKISAPILQKLFENKTVPLSTILEEIGSGLLSRHLIIRNILTEEFELVPILSYFKLENSDLYLKYESIIIQVLLDIRAKHPNGNWHHVIKLNSSNASSLYMVLGKYFGEVTFDLEMLKEEMRLIGNYGRYNNFKQKVLDQSIKEINIKTNIYVKWKEIIVERKVVQIKFNIRKNNQNLKDQAQKYNWVSLLGYRTLK